MSSKEYHFITHWTVNALPGEVYRILEDAESLKVWWPSVYLDVKMTHPGDSTGLGKEVALFTKGWLPYTLKWKFVTTHVQFPTGFTLEAIGDFKGKGIWTFENGKAPGTCDITYDWRIGAEKPLLRRLSFLLRPLFSFNHEWAMRKGYESLVLEIARRKAAKDNTKIRIASPPKATWPHRNKVYKVL